MTSVLDVYISVIYYINSIFYCLISNYSWKGSRNIVVNSVHNWHFQPIRSTDKYRKYFNGNDLSSSIKQQRVSTNQARQFSRRFPVDFRRFLKKFQINFCAVSAVLEQFMITAFLFARGTCLFCVVWAENYRAELLTPEVTAILFTR